MWVHKLKAVRQQQFQRLHVKIHRNVLRFFILHIQLLYIKLSLYYLLSCIVLYSRFYGKAVIHDLNVIKYIFQKPSKQINSQVPAFSFKPFFKAPGRINESFRFNHLF